MTHQIEPYNYKESPLLVVISGPSGVGKDMTLQRMKEMGFPFYFVVTATTRPKRPDEVDGADYFFTSMTEFAEMIEMGELLEYAVVCSERDCRVGYRHSAVLDLSADGGSSGRREEPGRSGHDHVRPSKDDVRVG